MKGKSDQHKPPLSPSMVEDGATERLKKRLKDLGLIVNAGAGKPAEPKHKEEKVSKAGRKRGGK